jgi:hypothetical protein
MERTRREFISESTVLLAGAALLADAPSLLAAWTTAVNWPIGCFNRPWTKWTFEETLAIKAAATRRQGAVAHEDRPVHRGRGDPEYPTARAHAGRERSRGEHGALRSCHDIPLEETVKASRRNRQRGVPRSEVR